MSFKSTIGLAVPYGFACASLYLYAYWHPVGLNPFHYANAADLVSATLGGIVISLAMMCIGMVLGLAVNPTVHRAASNSAATSSRLEKINAYSSILLLGGLLVIAWWKNLPVKWITTGVTLAALAPAFLRRNAWAIANFPTMGERLILSVVVFALPFTFYGQGAVGIHNALRLGSGMSVDAARSNLEANTVGTVMYIGMLGDFHVLREISSNTTLLVPGGNRIVIRKSDARGIQAKAEPSAREVATPAHH